MPKSLNAGSKNGDVSGQDNEPYLMESVEVELSKVLRPKGFPIENNNMNSALMFDHPHAATSP